MQVCCKSTGPRCSAWLDPAHLYSRVCRGSFWEAGVFLARGIDVSTAICEMHSEWAAIQAGTHGVSHPALGSRAIVGNPWVAEWQIGQTGKSQGLRAFIFLHSLLPCPLRRSWPGPRLLSQLWLIAPQHCWRVDFEANVGEGEWTMGNGAYWKEGLLVMCAPGSGRRNFPW